MDIMKICLLAIVGVLTAVMLRAHKAEYSALIGMAVCIAIFLFLLDKIALVIDYIDTVKGLAGVDNQFFTILIKMVGITYIAQFASDFCRDAGYQAIAGQIEIFAKLSIMLVSMPVMMALIEAIGEFL